jgi:hypothetical protein
MDFYTKGAFQGETEKDKRSNKSTSGPGLDSIDRLPLEGL